jgi:hypothetical protein
LYRKLKGIQSCAFHTALHAVRLAIGFMYAVSGVWLRLWSYLWSWTLIWKYHLLEL